MDGKQIPVDQNLRNQMNEALLSGRDTITVNGVRYKMTYEPGPGPNTVLTNGTYVRLTPARS
ncbi:hypothetical protein ACIRF8_08770 [Streptomyces sp. NPDC102406]|uniref:hypothetical protein n=1 Tax=Streptomyces sp. NPDC102406 TaxID=3366171 RepID=UPI003818A9DA